MLNAANTSHSAKAIIFAGGLLAIFCGAGDGPAAAASLYEEVSGDRRLTLFAGAVEQAGMAGILKQDGPYILLVPSDQALANEGSAFLLKGVLLTPANAGRLNDLVSYHIVPVEGLNADEIDDEDLATLRGAPIHLERFGEATMFNGWASVSERKEADNGVIFIIDRLLLPVNPDMN